MTPTKPPDGPYRPPETVGPTLALVAVVFALFVAASYPALTAVAVGGIGVGYVASRLTTRPTTRLGTTKPRPRP